MEEKEGMIVERHIEDFLSRRLSKGSFMKQQEEKPEWRLKDELMLTT